MKNKSENYLERCPVYSENLNWTTDDDQIVTLSMENKGLFNKIAQVIFKKPKISYIHLDEMGSFVWLVIDGKRNIEQIGILVKEHFGEDAEPLYERLAKYFQMLSTYNFITWKTEN